jgi:rhamnose transport system ATP-binding protein
VTAPVLALRNIAKAFGGTRALVNAELELHAGSVAALIGENGAGKSTLVKILSGVHRPDAGEILVDGKPVSIRTLADAQALGIAVIHQESVVFEDLSVAENIFIAGAPQRFRLLDWRSMKLRATQLLTQLEAPIDPRTLMRELSVAQRHLVQIARALSNDSRVVIMDEPTAALSHHEALDLLRIVQRLKTEGRAILFISHKFEEVLASADRYAVFRDGSAVGAGAVADTTLEQLIGLMVGRAVSQVFTKSEAPLGAEVLRVQALTRLPEYRDISFTLRRGEILGIYGLVGAGRSELMQTLFGLSSADSGQIFIDGQPLTLRSPAEAIRRGIAYVPEDRQHQGALLTQSIAENIALPNLGALSRSGIVNRTETGRQANDWATRLQVKCANTAQPVNALSGGNQQKVVLAKWLMTRPRVLILDEPTKGIDIGSKAAVHQLTSDLVRQGLAVILVSSELPEVLGMADRILVMRRGLARGLFDHATANSGSILRAALDG